MALVEANVLTMADGQPRAEAVLIDGERIVAVGSSDEIAAAAREGARVLDLGGLTVVPGFIDAHQHRIGNGPDALGRSAEQIVAEAIEQGLTTIHELYVDDGRLADLIALDEAGLLRLDVDAYLPVNENSEAGTVFEPYYDAYSPGEMVSANVRVAGLKVFTDFDNANVLLWRQRDLTDLVRDRHQDGWQLALKTVAVNSLDLILTALGAAHEADPTVAMARARLEHNLFATPEQIEQMAALGVVPAINLNMPGQGVGDPGIDDLVSRQPQDSYVPWRALFDAGLPAAGISGFPSYYVDEPTGAPFGSPIHLIYQAVTRVGNLGQRSPDDLMDQAISAGEALRSLTINAALAAFVEQDKGSIEPGKLADLVVLSADPLAADAEAINQIEVLMTMIGGNVEHCALPDGCLGSGAPSESEPPVPSSEPARGGISATASASQPAQPPSLAIDDDPATSWISGADAPQWIELDLGEERPITALRLTVEQFPEGETVHVVSGSGGSTGSELTVLHEFRGHTSTGDVLEVAFDEPVLIRRLRIETTDSPSWVAWAEIEVS